MLIYVLQWRQSWISDEHKKRICFRPPRAVSSQLWFLLIQSFPRVIFKNIFINYLFLSYFPLSIFRVTFMVFNTTFNNISVISWGQVLLVEETGVPGENHRLAACLWQTLSHYVASSTSCHEQNSNSQH